MSSNPPLFSFDDDSSVSSIDDDLLFPPLRQRLYPFIGVIGTVCRMALSHTRSDEVHPFNICRERKGVLHSELELSDTMFCRAYRMTRNQFALLLHFLQSSATTKKRVGPNGPIMLEMELSVALRYFAGGSAYDIMIVHGIGYNTVFQCVWRIVQAVNDNPRLAMEFPVCHEKQAQIADGFQKKSRVKFFNCVGCIDGMLLWTECPSEKQSCKAFCGSNSFLCGRKNKFGFNMQAICDSERRFLQVWINHPASSSDFLAFVKSEIYKSLKQPGFLAPGLVLFGDNAYCSNNFIVTLYKRIYAGSYDDYNFYHSQLCINIECAFGMLVHRWGILRRPLSSKISMDRQTGLAIALCRLHNFCIDYKTFGINEEEEEIIELEASNLL